MIGILPIYQKLPGRLFLLFIIFFFWAGLNTAVAQTSVEPIVQALLFYSPTCPHCHQVITVTLPPLIEQYGEQLQILGIDTSQEEGGYLYQAAVVKFNIPEHRLGVPALIVGDVVLVGSVEIPERFPALIADGLAAGGMGWPDIPNLREIVPDLPPSAATEPTVMETATAVLQPTEAPEETAVPTPITATAVSTEPVVAVLSLDEMAAGDSASAETAVPPSDPAGFALGWTVLAGMVAGLVYGGKRWMRIRPFVPTPNNPVHNRWQTVVVLGLVAIGLIVAMYLAYVEITHVTAVCGPIGECNIVQSSPYAQIMGIPVAVLGALSYLLIGAFWLWRRPLNEKWPGLAGYGLLALTFLGALFSIYLTALELLIIRAVCAWCLTSAVVIALLFLMVVKDGRNGEYWQRK